ncbi:TPA: hypothetical protein H1U83_004415 [Salmonella enterica]|uniref:Uncharacterized protein n=1 Tax=Salmonella enterica subsp. enterica serovar Panama TaxID=29472 RepID=A0A6D2D845_SALET|nr:hypothetical protein [Salmonella enterica]TRQ67752.1 hypothetical protein DNP61_20395 [Salmonella enterica subsp. enterica serovar Panama]TRQ78173.1 hypothetical protein DNP62_20345 [Salmonella enterica subsp. enterica serovar Panama]TRQ80975.1 hypothetical protein DNP59_19530 [Salmonella enterica subsp. enterica serovar Panama]TRQ82611.1 hypothetical protein DNP60_19990 [Salmonella enterica subsp. enterica serovar Panama]TRQ92225.1 hypothetical protein DNP58_20485 [Salmonella enterica subs
MMTESFFDWVVYCITGVILASAFLEGKRTRFPAAFFYGSIVLLVVLIVAGALNWWFYRSKFGSVVVIFAATTLLMTRFRLVIYAFRFRTLVADLQSHLAKGFRIILVLPENEDEKTVLLSKLSKVIHSGTLFYTRTALGPYSGDLLHALGQKHRNGEGYLLLCEQQLPARTWLSTVENGQPEKSIAVNFHSIPDME